MSTNNGQSWSQINNGLTSLYVQTILLSVTNIFAGTQNGKLLSDYNYN